MMTKMSEIKKYIYARRMLRMLLAASGAICGISPAWGYGVKGEVCESPSGEKCIGASVIVYVPADSAATQKVAVADEEGRFQLALPKPGNYRASFKYLGCRDIFKDFSLTDSAPEADLGTIAMPRDDKTLEELLVVARRKLISSDGATLTYNVEDDPTSKSSSTLDMLRHVPMVTVDAQDNIKVNGKSNFKIYINGKEDPMMSGDAKTVLKSMPASSIKKIEVLTEPGAKYDSEGVGGILNIVTSTKTSLQGYMVNALASVSDSSAGGYLYGISKIGKVTFNLSGNYSHSIASRNQEVVSETEIFNAERNHLQREAMDNRQKSHHFAGGDFNMSWEPDTLNLYTMAFNIRDFGVLNTAEGDVSMTDIYGKPVWNYHRSIEMEYSRLNMGANVSYQHTFGRQGHNLVASYIYDHGTNNNNSYQNRFNGDGIELKNPYQTNLREYTDNRHSAQIDYTNPFNGHHTLETGLKGDWRNNNGFTRMGEGRDPQDVTFDDSQAVKLNQFRNVAAAYAAYTGSFGSWTLKGGVRYEHTSMGVNYQIGGYTNFKSILNDWVPNASVAFNFANSSNLRAAYSMRINRPDLSALNPYRNTMTIGEISYGNPNLKSERANLFSLTYSNYGGVVSGSFTASYSQVNNNIQSYKFVDKDNIINTTYANIGQHRMVGFNGNMQWTPVSSFQLSLWGSLNYDDFRADSPELTARNHGWGGDIGANVDYTFPFKLKVSAYGGWGSEGVDLQSSESYTWHFYSLALSRDFLKDGRLNIQVNASSFFNPYSKFRYEERTEDMRIMQSCRYPQWRVGLSVSYRLGSLSAHVRKTNAYSGDESGTSSGSSNTSPSGAGPAR